MKAEPRSRTQPGTKRIGTSLLALVTILFALPPINAIARLQDRLDFKALTGALLVLFIAFQLLLSVARARHWGQTARKLYPMHHVVGSFGPIFLYLHASRIGYGYLALLSGVFLSNLALGLTYPASARSSKKLIASWTVAHIALSVSMVALVGYHVFHALYYE